MAENKLSDEFLLKEYDQCWEYIKFHYEQRDRSQRFFFGFVTGAAGIAAGLFKLEDNNLPQFLIVVSVPLIFLGVFTLFQLITIRKTTTVFHKNIIAIRQQIIGDYKTFLHISLEKQKYYKTGFNFWTILIIIATNTILIVILTILVMKEFEYSICQSILLSFVTGIGSIIFQFCSYRQALKKEDKNGDKLNSLCE